MHGLNIWVALISAANLLTAGTALALRCGDNLVSLGDSQFEVLAKCGEPMQRTHFEETGGKSGDKDRHPIRKSIDEWTFNFGPHEFLYFLRFEDGRLSELRTGGYGSAVGPSDSSCRHGQLLSLGDSMAEALLKCGEPTRKEHREESSGAKSRESVAVDDWTYNFGRNNFLYFLRFENGRVVTIRTGGYGFDPPAPP